jgi:hypothetical protein
MKLFNQIFLLIAISFSLFTFNCSLLYAQETIIDSVYATPVLDGEITFSQYNQCFVVNNWMYDFYMGDIGDNGLEPQSDNNSYARSFISFELPEIPEGYQVDSVYIRLYQYESTGNSGWYQTDPQDFPVWDVPGGDTIQCVVSHIDYGNELDVGDWEKGDTGNPYTYQHNVGVMTESGEDGYRYLDVTSSVLQDYELNRDKTQYRIAFDGIDTDWDDLYDNVWFKSANSWVEEHRPQLFIIFKDDVNIGEGVIEDVDFSISNFPNPINPSVAERSPKTTICYQIPNSGIIKLQIFNIAGQLIETLVDEYQNTGMHSVEWNGEDSSGNRVSSGMRAGDFQKVRKMILIK